MAEHPKWRYPPRLSVAALHANRCSAVSLGITRTLSSLLVAGPEPRVTDGFSLLSDVAEAHFKKWHRITR